MKKMQFDKTGNIALLLVCIGGGLLIILFHYLIEVFVLSQEFDLLHALLIAFVVSVTTGYIAYKNRKKKNK